MLCKRKCKYNISIVSSVSARPVNKNCILEKKEKKKRYALVVVQILDLVQIFLFVDDESGLLC